MRYSYDTRLNLIAIQDPKGFVQERVFDTAGNLIAERTPLNSTQSAVVQFTYDSNHRMVTQTDPNGNQTKYSYSGGNVASITPPGNGNGATKLKYDGHGLLTAIDTPIGSQTFAYDAVGNQVRANELGQSGQTLNGNGSRTTYNEAGQATSFTDARGVPTSGAVDPKLHDDVDVRQRGQPARHAQPRRCRQHVHVRQRRRSREHLEPRWRDHLRVERGRAHTDDERARRRRHHAELRPVGQRARRDVAQWRHDHLHLRRPGPRRGDHRSGRPAHRRHLRRDQQRGAASTTAPARSSASSSTASTG